jgi:hypothetical protein
MERICLLVCDDCAMEFLDPAPRRKLCPKCAAKRAAERAEAKREDVYYQPRPQWHRPHAQYELLKDTGSDPCVPGLRVTQLEAQDGRAWADGTLFRNVATRVLYVMVGGVLDILRS